MIRRGVATGFTRMAETGRAPSICGIDGRQPEVRFPPQADSRPRGRHVRKVPKRTHALQQIALRAHFPFAVCRSIEPARKRKVIQEPTFHGLIGISVLAGEFVFVFYLHRERRGLFVRLSQLLRKRTPLPNDVVPGIHLVHLSPFTLSPSVPADLPIGHLL